MTGPKPPARGGATSAWAAARVFQSRAPYWCATSSRASLWVTSTPRSAREVRRRLACCLWSVDMTLLFPADEDRACVAVVRLDRSDRRITDGWFGWYDGHSPSRIAPGAGGRLPWPWQERTPLSRAGH